MNAGRNARPDSTPARREYWSVNLVRILGAGSLFAYHFINDLRLQDGAVYQTAGPLGFLGYFGVALFIVISGLVLGKPWERDATYGAFLRRRLVSLFSLYWWIAIPLIAAGLAVGMMPLGDLWKAPFWLLGLNSLGPEIFRPLVSAWWYMGLALQIVLVYPLVHGAVRRLGGAGAVLAAGAVVAASSLAIGALPSQYGYLYDGFIGARMLELTFGAVIGSALRSRTERRSLFAAASAYGLMTLAAVTIEPTTTLRAEAGVAAVVLCAGMVWLEQQQVLDLPGRATRAVAALGGLSFAFYLVHPPLVRMSIAALEPLAGPATAPLAAAGSLGIAWVFSRSHEWAARPKKQRSGTR